MDDKDKQIEQLEKIIALTPGHIYWKDRQGKYLGCNETFVKVLKLPNRQAVIGKSDYDLMSKELADIVSVIDQDIMAKGEGHVLEEIGFDINGECAIYLTKKVPLHDDEGKVIGILGTSIDITERKKSEEKLELANKLKSDFISNMSYLDNIIALLPGNIYWKNREGVYLGCNDNAANTVGLKSRTEVVGKKLHDFVDKKFADIIEENDERIMQNNQEETIEENAFDSLGNPAIYLTRKAPLHNEEGEVIGILGVSLDISDRKRQEEELRETKDRAEAASRAKSDFLAVISHELRIPLTGILGMAQLIDDDNLYDEQRDQLDDLVKSGNHLLSLVNDLLDIAKLEAGKMELNPAHVNLHKIVDEMTTIISHQAELKGLDLIVDYPQDIPSLIVADPKALRQIILNLTGNAIKFTESGHVIIKVECLEQNTKQAVLAISVCDTGIGIPENKQAIIFDRFAQADGTRTRRFGGTGLGLAIVKEYVEGMGGTVTVKSKVGEGTIFTCQISFELQAKTKPVNPWVVHQANVRILIVDDTLRGEVLKKQIGSSLSQVCESRNVLNVIRTAYQAGKPFDIVIIDNQITTIESQQLAKTIHKQRNLSQPMLLLLTSKLTMPLQKVFKEAGFFDFLIKPIQPLETLISLTAAWERWQEAKKLKANKLGELISSESLELRSQVLLVEDEPITQRVHKLMLEKAGCHVDIASTGKEALSMFANKCYDLVFMDIALPDMDGFEVTKNMRLQEIERGYSPIIGITGYDSSQDREKCFLAGMDIVVIKPVKPEEIKDIVNQFLGKKLSNNKL